ncbi:MAG: radical SAM family heme chaperone HemW [Desulfobacterales bacterium]|nr:radical SAM family heme chaperone HemW [Desulfobacterales bacterium]
MNRGGIYVHVPFCRRKCPYCDFYSVTDLGRTPAFLDGLEREVRLTRAGRRVFDSIYLGGGTPSLLAPAEVARILAALFAHLRFEAPVEITLEANPGTLGPQALAGFRAAGVNRLNIGVQSFRDETLARLGRIHSAAEARRALAQARSAGFGNLGIDLMYGLPGQGLAEWRRELAAAVRFGPEHIACYMLTLEPGTPLSDAHRDGRFHPAAEGRVAQLFLATVEFLTGHGYRHYEVSNFARAEAYLSRHNGTYWSYRPYVGFGPAAHSFLPPRRFWNHRSLERYLADLAADKLPRAGQEKLTPAQQMTEFIMLGLRTTEGVGLAEFQRRFGVDFNERFGAAAAELESRRLLTLRNGRCAATPRGMLCLNSVTAALT